MAPGKFQAPPRAACIIFALVCLSACGAPAPRYSTLEDLNRESCLQSIKPGDNTETEVVAALRACKTVTKVDDPLPSAGTQSTAHRWQLASGPSGNAETTEGVLLTRSYNVAQGMPLGDILSTYGKPDAAWRSDSGSAGQCSAVIRLLYLQRALAFELVRPYACGSDFIINAALNSTGYAQFVSGNLDEVLKSAYHLAGAALAQAHTEIRPWTGYDSLKRAPP